MRFSRKTWFFDRSVGLHARLWCLHNHSRAYKRPRPTSSSPCRSHHKLSQRRCSFLHRAYATIYLSPSEMLTFKLQALLGMFQYTPAFRIAHMILTRLAHPELNSIHYPWSERVSLFFWAWWADTQSMERPKIYSLSLCKCRCVQ